MRVTRTTTIRITYLSHAGRASAAATASTDTAVLTLSGVLLRTSKSDGSPLPYIFLLDSDLTVKLATTMCDVTAAVFSGHITDRYMGHMRKRFYNLPKPLFTLENKNLCLYSK